MRLSMWMIANRLHALEPEVNIKDDSPMELCGVRNVMAPNCVYVYKKKQYVYIQYGEDYIRFHDIEFDYLFNMVQGIFEFYNDWSDTVQQAVYDMNFQKIMDECWAFVGNPIILMDGNNRCLGMCSQYMDDEVDDEWAYVSQHRVSSPEFIKRMRRSYSVVDMYRKNRIQLLRKENIDIYYDTLSSAIYYRNCYCGRLNVLGKERSFNMGDIQVLEYLLKIITPALYLLQNNDTQRLSRSVFLELISGNKISKELLQEQMHYLEWGSTDIYQICVLKVPERMVKEENQELIESMIRRYTINVYVASVAEDIVVLFNLKYMDKKMLTESFESFISPKEHYVWGFSNPMCGLENLQYYYEQAISAITYGQLFKPDEKYYYFNDYALYYLLENNDVPRLYCAMNSDIKYLEEKDRAYQKGYLPLLKAFFDNECSLVNTAKATYMHRNTLVYRLGKIAEQMHYDWHNTYDRDYMKQSILLLDFYRKKYGDDADLMRVNQN